MYLNKHSQIQKRVIKWGWSWSNKENAHAAPLLSASQSFVHPDVSTAPKTSSPCSGYIVLFPLDLTKAS